MDKEVRLINPKNYDLSNLLSVDKRYLILENETRVGMIRVYEVLYNCVDELREKYPDKLFLYKWVIRKDIEMEVRLLNDNDSASYCVCVMKNNDDE